MPKTVKMASTLKNYFRFIFCDEDYNKIGDEGARYLAEVNWPHLKELLICTLFIIYGATT